MENQNVGIERRRRQKREVGLRMMDQGPQFDRFCLSIDFKTKYKSQLFHTSLKNQHFCFWKASCKFLSLDDSSKYQLLFILLPFSISFVAFEQTVSFSFYIPILEVIPTGYYFQLPVNQIYSSSLRVQGHFFFIFHTLEY